MKNWKSLKELTECFYYQFEVRLQEPPYSATNLAFYCEDYLNYDIVVLKDETAKNVIYAYIGHLLCKHGKYIQEHFVNCINASIEEVEKNYRKLDLTDEEQLEILEIARQVKIDLPKLKVFPDSTSLIKLEMEEYKKEHGIE